LAAAVNDDAAQAAGVTDEEIAETIGHVTLNALTNYINTAWVSPSSRPVPRQEDL
jgi:alkylhydroperoxidase/carboxymuconolactone decarboxylase family protein YurZ